MGPIEHDWVGAMRIVAGGPTDERVPIRARVQPSLSVYSRFGEKRAKNNGAIPIE